MIIYTVQVSAQIILAQLSENMPFWFSCVTDKQAVWLEFQHLLLNHSAFVEVPLAL